MNRNTCKHLKIIKHVYLQAKSILMSKIKCKGQFLPKRMIGTEKLKTFEEHYKDRKKQESCIYKTKQKPYF